MSLLELQGVGKTYTSRYRGKSGRREVRAADNVSFTVEDGESVGLAGESGSGKSTLARMILRLEDPTDGVIRFEGNDVSRQNGAGLLEYRCQVQAVFQDCTGALSPRMRIGDIVAEPLVIQQPDLVRSDREARVEEVLSRVGLDPGLVQRFPHELSGGQKQRVAIARSLVNNPKMLVLDEPVSALDMSVRSQVLNLLLDLQEEFGLTYLMIAHDLAVLRHVTTRLLVLYRGKIVEEGPTEEVLFNPRHEYTRRLVASAPQVDLKWDEADRDGRASQAERQSGDQSMKYINGNQS